MFFHGINLEITQRVSLININDRSRYKRQSNWESKGQVNLRKKWYQRMIFLNDSRDVQLPHVNLLSPFT